MCPSSLPFTVPPSKSQSVRQLSWRLCAASTDSLESPPSVPENSSGENSLSDELPVWPQEIPTEKDLLLCGKGSMISMCSFVEKGSMLRILTDGASIGLGELRGQSVLKVGEIHRDESEYVWIQLVLKASTTIKPATQRQTTYRLNKNMLYETKNIPFHPFFLKNLIFNLERLSRTGMLRQPRSSCKTQSTEGKTRTGPLSGCDSEALAHRAWRPGAMSRDPSMGYLLAESITSVTVTRAVFGASRQEFYSSCLQPASSLFSFSNF